MKRLLVLSGKGGTGKTTVSAAFIRLSKARAAADCDVDAPNLHLVMEQETEPEVTEFMGETRRKQIRTSVPAAENAKPPAGLKPSVSLMERQL